MYLLPSHLLISYSFLLFVTKISEKSGGGTRCDVEEGEQESGQLVVVTIRDEGPVELIE